MTYKEEYKKWYLQNSSGTKVLTNVEAAWKACEKLLLPKIKELEARIQTACEILDYTEGKVKGCSIVDAINVLRGTGQHTNKNK